MKHWTIDHEKYKHAGFPVCIRNQKTQYMAPDGAVYYGNTIYDAAKRLASTAKNRKIAYRYYYKLSRHRFSVLNAIEAGTATEEEFTALCEWQDDRSDYTDSELAWYVLAYAKGDKLQQLERNLIKFDKRS